MVLKRILIVIILLFFFNCAVQAQTYNKNIAKVGVQAYYHKYEEPGLMENEGYFLGVSYSFLRVNRVVLGIEGLISYGQVDYSSETTGESDDIDDLCLDTRIILGHELLPDVKNITLVPYMGVAHRYLQDDSSNKLTSSGAIGYLRRSNYYYIPLGIRMDMQIGNGWHMQPMVEYSYFFKGMQRSELGYLAGYEDIENDQDDGYGYRVSLAFEKRFRTNAFSLELFYRYWDIEDSDVTVDSWSRAWIEPANNTSEYGLNFSFHF